MGAHDIGLNKSIRSGDRSVDVAFGSKMHDAINVVCNQQFLYEHLIADIAVYKSYRLLL